MGAGAFIEPLVVVSLLFGGTWFNRNTSYRLFSRGLNGDTSVQDDYESELDSLSSASSSLGDEESYGGSSSLLTPPEPRWRKRELKLAGFSTCVTTPNTKVFHNRFLSRLLRKFPFLVEAWYWALIYWVYQLGRAFTAVTMVENTVNIAREHALQLVHLEQRLHIFFEINVQRWFLGHPVLMTWTNRVYSFIHIPGTILFLVLLYYYTTTRNRLDMKTWHTDVGEVDGSPAGPHLYEARRRTMAVCNLIAFVIFTLWPCMPPRLLSDESVKGEVGEETRKYGFVDTVHGKGGESSVWTQNKFCNQYAAMPSLHFGYSLLIGLTILTIPLSPSHRRSRTLAVRVPALATFRIHLPSVRRLLCLIVGVAYPALILTAIIATANHFVLDAVAGTLVCAIAWKGNGVLLNLLALEDWFLWLVRIDKPVVGVVDVPNVDKVGDKWLGGKGVLVD